MRLDITSAAIWYAAGITFAIALSGCPLSTTPPGATTAQKLQADIKAVEKVCTDVKAQCGDKFASFSPTLTTAINGVLNYANPISDIETVAKLIPELKDDYDALACVVRVIRDDIKSFQPAKAAELDRILVQLEARQCQPLLAYSDPVPEPCTNAGDEGTCRKVSNSGHVEWPDAGADGGQ